VRFGSEAFGRLSAAADLLVHYPYEIWHYGDSIGFEGLLTASDLLGTPRYEAWVHGALKAWTARQTPFRELDNTAPGHAMCLCFERTEDEAIIQAASRLADFLAARPQVEDVFVSFSEAPLRKPYGRAVLSPSETALLDSPGRGVFVDCLHFDPPFFAHLGSLTQDERLIDLAAQQALGYVRLLQDESGLFWHFFLEKTQTRYGYGWSRGQGWALLGLLDTLVHLPNDHASADTLRASFARLASALMDTQHESGGWSAVATEERSETESSTSAFAAAGLAGGAMRGLLDRDAVRAAIKAWKEAWSHVDERGVLLDVSAAVWASTEASHYWAVPKGFVVPWGQGPLLLAAKRVSELSNVGLDR
jgi:unsaturated rhamnogalacturonyl hydrolase